MTHPPIRPARAEDVAVIARIEQEAFSDPWVESAFWRLLGEPQVFFACAADDDEVGVLGYVVAWFVADEGEIANLAVAPASRQRGIGHALLRAVLAEAARRGVRSVYLEVRDSNEQARRLYGAEGFREVGRRRGYYRRPPEDAIVLCRTLPAESQELQRLVR